MKLSQMRLLVADVGRSVRFYRDVLGLRLNWGDETSRYASFETGGGRAQLAVFDRTAMAETVTAVDPPCTPDRAVIVFGVDNMDTALDEIRERGGLIAHEPVDRPAWGIRVAYLRDPDDNLIELAWDMPREDWEPDVLAEADAHRA
jgi:lactoylglutathione lyase